MHYFPKILTLYSHFIEANGPVRMKALQIRFLSMKSRICSIILKTSSTMSHPCTNSLVQEKMLPFDKILDNFEKIPSNHCTKLDKKSPDLCQIVPQTKTDYVRQKFDCLEHPNLSATLATNQKLPLSRCLRISYQSLAECYLP